MQRRLVLVTVIVGLSIGIGASARQPQPQPAAGHRPDHMEHRFDDPARYAQQFDDPARDGWQMPDRVLAALRIDSGRAVADIGTGTGYFSSRLARLPAAPTVYAVDIEPKMIEYVKARAAKEGVGNIVGVLASPESPNLPAPVDVALIVDTYHHIGNRVEYFRRLRGSLKPGGRLAIIDFRKDSPDGPPAEFRFTADQITAELVEAGYELAETHDFLPRQMFLVYRVK